MNIGTLKVMLERRKNREQIYCTPEYWDAKAAELEGDAVSMWSNNYLNAYYHQEQLSLFEKYLPSLEQANVLDIGCGTGRISRYLSDKGASVLGIDFSAKAITIASQQSTKINPIYRVQSLFNLEEIEQFDLLVSWGSLTVACKNREDLFQVMKRLRQSLKFNGTALFLEPIHQGFLHRVLDMNLQEFCEVMESSGFEIEVVRHLHFWPVRLLLCYVTLPKWITAFGYHLGESIMKLINRQAFGDYKMIVAKVK